MLSRIWNLTLTLMCACAALSAHAKSFDGAAAFGARPSVSGMSLSPDGKSVAYVVPGAGQGAVVYTRNLEKGSIPKRALSADGRPFRIEGCHWVSNERLVCAVYAPLKSPGVANLSRLISVDADGTNPQDLGTRTNDYSHAYPLFGGAVIDWLPDEDGAVLMERVYVPDDHIGSRIGSGAQGLGVDWVDTRTLEIRHVEGPRRYAVGYVTDGRGVVRIMSVATKRGAGSRAADVITNLYRLPGSREWRTLGEYDPADGSGFEIGAVDHDLNIAYAFKKKDGRKALYSIALDESKREDLIYARPDVDVDELIRIGRRRRVVGASFALEARKAEFFVADIHTMLASLAKTLPGNELRVTESSLDEQKLLVFAGSDTDPGVYYIFDRPAHRLETFLVARSELEGTTLSVMKPVTYPASDGTMIPAYLTLPPGHESAKGLPAIVMPHGGPSYRDEWGFDWLSQFYAARGFAVLQPNFRGSAGYGDAWLLKGGYRSWSTAIGDILDAGRWLVNQGIADSSKLAVVGWSYGGYAALQSAVVDSALFKAVVAIAPVTDLAALKTEHVGASEFVGGGQNMSEGSPVEHADKIKVPVMLFHGDFDHNVSVEHSKRMAARLAAAGARCELITWPDLDHQLEDATARAQMLRKSDEFLRKELGIADTATASLSASF